MCLISEDEKDVITELMNIGVGHAAAAFSQMIGEEIRMSVPDVEVCDRRSAAGLLRSRLPGVLGGVRQTFEGPLTGVAALIFPERESLQIVRTVLGQASCPIDDITELEQETLLEIGNIVLNHCLGTISNTLGLGCRSSLPQSIEDGEFMLFSDENERSDGDGLVLFLHITFAIKSIDANGYLAFLLDVDGAQVFLHHVRCYIDRFPVA